MLLLENIRHLQFKKGDELEKLTYISNIANAGYLSWKHQLFVASMIIFAGRYILDAKRKI